MSSVFTVDNLPNIPAYLNQGSNDAVISDGNVIQCDGSLSTASAWFVHQFHPVSVKTSVDSNATIKDLCDKVLGAATFDNDVCLAFLCKILFSLHLKNPVVMSDKWITRKVKEDGTVGEELADYIGADPQGELEEMQAGAIHHEVCPSIITITHGSVTCNGGGNSARVITHVEIAMALVKALSGIRFKQFPDGGSPGVDEYVTKIRQTMKSYSNVTTFQLTSSYMQGYNKEDDIEKVAAFFDRIMIDNRDHYYSKVRICTISLYNKGNTIINRYTKIIQQFNNSSYELLNSLRTENGIKDCNDLLKLVPLIKVSNHAMSYQRPLQYVSASAFSATAMKHLFVYLTVICGLTSNGSFFNARMMVSDVQTIVCAFLYMTYRDKMHRLTTLDPTSAESLVSTYERKSRQAMENAPSEMSQMEIERLRPYQDCLWELANRSKTPESTHTQLIRFSEDPKFKDAVYFLTSKSKSTAREIIQKISTRMIKHPYLTSLELDILRSSATNFSSRVGSIGEAIMAMNATNHSQIKFIGDIPGEVNTDLRYEYNEESHTTTAVNPTQYGINFSERLIRMQQTDQGRTTSNTDQNVDVQVEVPPTSSHLDTQATLDQPEDDYTPPQ